MTVAKSLPARPSLDSLRKQAKKLARDVAAGDAAAIERVRAHLPTVDLPVTQRNAQLVIAREYGFAGWQELTAEAGSRLGKGLDSAVAQARRIIHDNDVERMKPLLDEYPALLSWRGDDGGLGLLGMATSAYGDAGDDERERWFTRAACAELLLDAGAVVAPGVCEGILQSRARGLLDLFQRRGLLPRTLPFLAALGDLDAVRAVLDEGGRDAAVLTNSFARACSFKHEEVASRLLARAVELDPELGRAVDEGPGRRAFIAYFAEHGGLDLEHALAFGLWKAFVMSRIGRTAHTNDAAAFTGELQQDPWLLGDGFVQFQSRLIEIATLNDREEIIAALLALDPAILRRRPPPTSQAIEFALTYAHTRLVQLLVRVWPLPDDLPHAAGMGNLARVRQWFDESGAFAPGDLGSHYPYNDPRARSHLGWETPTAQQVLDVALAYAVTNNHFEVADFLLGHGADIDTRWSSHEPASLLHHLVFNGTYESMQFLIDRGIDMTIKDYRWNATAQGWAFHARRDEKMAQWLGEAQLQRERKR